MKIYLTTNSMKFLKILIIIIIIIALVIWIMRIKGKITNIFNTENLAQEFNTLIQNIKWIDTWDIQNSLSGKIEEAKWLAEQYYNDVLKDYVDKAKDGVSWAVESAKWYYNQWIDDIWETITNKINNKVSEWLEKIKVK